MADTLLQSGQGGDSMIDTRHRITIRQTVAEIEIVELQGAEQMEALQRLQEEAWGSEERVPASQMTAAVHNGGLVLAAFIRDRPVGLSYAFPGRKKDAVYLWSQRLAVDPKLRDRGIGEQLRRVQYQWVLENGYTEIRWSFDPLRARNAHLNLNKLGAVGIEYVKDLYGQRHDPANQGLLSDRMIVSWHVVPQTELREVPTTAPNPLDAVELPQAFDVDTRIFPLPCQSDVQWIEQQMLQANRIGVLVCTDIDEIRAHSPSVALAWRMALREAMSCLFAGGMQAVALLPVAGEPRLRQYLFEHRGA
ncbi:MAG: GNAT family N-acetyltransferase [Firmicutes bacterium]|nr:GNAT family N-acetyltransferase [Bacillota bacterium]